jgi:hypothetical protein
MIAYPAAIRIVPCVEKGTGVDARSMLDDEEKKSPE